MFSEIVISTDSGKLINKYYDNKYLKIFKRKKSLTRDDCLQDLIKEVPKICLGRYILWTHVTSPVFCSKDYMDFEIFFQSKSLKVPFLQQLSLHFLWMKV